MSVSFYGLDAEGRRITLDIAHPASLNMANGNARNVLEFLGLDPGDGPSGEVSLVEARRAVIRARATFGRRAPTFIRPPTDTRRPGRARVIVAGIDEDYLVRRLDDFERFLAAVATKGAISIRWG